MQNDNKSSRVKNLSIGKAKKTLRDKYGIERPKPRVGLIEKFNRSYDMSGFGESRKKR